MADKDEQHKPGVNQAEDADPAQTIDLAPASPAKTTLHRASAAESEQGSTVRRTADFVPKTGQPPAAVELPEQFGRYRIRRKLGQGAMGAVYLAHDQQLDRKVALKVPFFNEKDGPDVIQRFYREARAMATVHHANLCSVFDVGEIAGVHFLAMAFIDGRPLEDYLKEGKSLPSRQVATVIRKLALALEEAHRADIVHRDLKPANVMIDKRNEPIIMDFGLARRDIEGEAALTHTGAIMGTPAYMAPELIEGIPEKIGPHTDIFALGVIIYEMTCGRRPFDGSVGSVLSQILMHEPTPPATINTDVAPELEQICLKAMSKSVEDRYPSAAELAADLGRFLRDGQLAATTAPRSQPDSPAKVKPQPAVQREPSVAAKPRDSEFKIDLDGGDATATSRHRRQSGQRAKPAGGRGINPLGITVAAAAAVLVLLVVVLLVTGGRSPEPGPADSSPVADPVAKAEPQADPAAATSDSTAAAKAAGSQLWEFRTEAPVRCSPAIGHDGTVYVGSDNKKVYALQADTGAVLWEFKTEAAVQSSPAVGSDGTIYFGSWDKNLYALNAENGEPKWRFETENGVHSYPAIGTDGTVYFGSLDGRVYAVDGKSGGKKWAVSTEGKVYCSPAIGPDGTVYIGSDDGKVYALDGGTGQVQWIGSTGGKVFSSPAIGGDGTVYVGSDDGTIYAFHGGSGQVQWTRPTEGAIKSCPAIAADGTVYIGSNDRNIYALDGGSGKVKWMRPTGSEVHSTPAIGDDGTVYVGSGDGILYALNGRTGKRIWVYSTDGPVWSSPAIGADGTVYVASDDEKIHAVASDSGGPANSPWPMRGGNSQHTGRAVRGVPRPAAAN